MHKRTKRPFYEYYFEPVGTNGMVFFQFMDDDFEHGMQTKREIEKLFDRAQIMMYILLFLAVLIGLTKSPYRYPFLFFVLLVFLLRIFNPIIANYKLYKAQKQSIFRDGPTKEFENDFEPFDV